MKLCSCRNASASVARWRFCLSQILTVVKRCFLPYKSLLRNQMLFVLKDIWTSSTNCSTTETRRFSEPARGIWPTGSSTEWASRDSPRRSAFRYCDGFEGQRRKSISLCFASNSGTALNAPKGYSGYFKQHLWRDVDFNAKWSLKLKSILLSLKTRLWSIKWHI